jgi:hypothetical protein
MEKHELFETIRSWPIEQENYDKPIPAEIDELSLLLSKDLCQKISRNFAQIEFSLYDWARFQESIQVEISRTIRNLKFTPPPYPPSLEVNWDKPS